MYLTYHFSQYSELGAVTFRRGLFYKRRRLWRFLTSWSALGGVLFLNLWIWSSFKIFLFFLSISTLFESNLVLTSLSSARYGNYVDFVDTSLFLIIGSNCGLISYIELHFPYSYSHSRAYKRCIDLSIAYEWLLCCSWYHFVFFSPCYHCVLFSLSPLSLSFLRIFSINNEKESC